MNSRVAGELSGDVQDPDRSRWLADPVLAVSVSELRPRSRRVRRARARSTANSAYGTRERARPADDAVLERGEIIVVLVGDGADRARGR